MVKRFCLKYCYPFRDRFVACIAIGIYLFALGAIPAFGGHLHTCLCESLLEFEPPAPEEVDPISDLIRLTVPFFTADVPFPLQIGFGSDLFFTLFIPPVANAAALPPCRAPPVL